MLLVLEHTVSATVNR